MVHSPIFQKNCDLFWRRKIGLKRFESRKYLYKVFENTEENVIANMLRHVLLSDGLFCFRLFLFPANYNTTRRRYPYYRHEITRAVLASWVGTYVFFVRAEKSRGVGAFKRWPKSPWEKKKRKNKSKPPLSFNFNRSDSKKPKRTPP